MYSLLSEKQVGKSCSNISMGQQEELNEKTEQNAPLLSPDEYAHETSDSESVHSEDMALEASSTVSSLHPAFFIA